MPYFCYAWPLLLVLRTLKQKTRKRRCQRRAVGFVSTPSTKLLSVAWVQEKHRPSHLRPTSTATAGHLPASSWTQGHPLRRLRPTAHCSACCGGREVSNEQEGRVMSREGCLQTPAMVWVLLLALTEVINKSSCQALHKQLLCFPHSPAAPQEALKAIWRSVGHRQPRVSAGRYPFNKQSSVHEIKVYRIGGSL